VLPLTQVENYLNAFRSGLAAEGYVEGRDFEVLAHSPNGDRERLSAVVDEVVRLKPDLIINQGAAIFGVRKVTDIPVVYGFSGDPITAELTTSMARRSQNLTGVSFMAVEMNAKRLDLLRTAVPNAKKVVLMGDPIHPGVDREIAASQEMARRLGIELRWMPTRNVQEVSDLLVHLGRGPPDALVALPDGVMLDNQKQIAEFAVKHRLPAISGWSTFAQSGGLFTYGPSLSESFRRLAYYAARILKGRSLPTYPSKARPGSNWSLISRLPISSGSSSRPHSSPRQTRSLSILALPGLNMRVEMTHLLREKARLALIQGQVIAAETLP
jgi:putative ABC transport system substrate-binding protein